MSFLDNFSIKSRLLATFGLVLALMALMVTLGAINNRKNADELHNLLEKEFLKFEMVASIDSLTKANARNTLELFLVSGEQRAAVRQRMGQTKKELDTLFERLDTQLSLPRGRELFDDLKIRRLAFVAAFSKASKTLEAGDLGTADELLKSEVLPSIDALKTPVEALLSFQKELAHQRGANIETAMSLQNKQFIGLGVVAAVIGLGSALMLLTSIMTPLRQAIGVAKEVAKGNLAVEFTVSGKNELSDMLEALSQMKESLSHVIMRIQESANSVASASQQIAAANTDLSGRTEEQASSLEETAASMEEMTSTVQQNAHATRSANQLAEAASVSAKQVGELVGSVVHTMHDIHSSSQRITDIVSVIDSIAFQTNILALNAAVEAARAGEQGRGFAVVASEVRALAQRSAAAAQEIKGIIVENVAKMTAGNTMVQRAGEAVVVAVDAINKVTQTVAEIDVASREQTAGIEQVGQAVAQMDMATQQNAALVEETAAASKSLDDQVQSLTNSINRFNIGRKASTGFLALGT